MNKLLPPTIEGVLPAFVGNTLIIPFEHNATVGTNYSGFTVKISTLISGTIIGSSQVSQQGNNLIVTNSHLADKGELFAVQVAYIDLDGVAGYFSNTATVRKIPHQSSQANIQVLNNGELLGNFCFVDNNNNPVSTNEVPVSYVFNIYDEEGNLFETSEEQIHKNNNANENKQFIDNYILKKELLNSQNYDVYYTITTINGYTKTVYAKIASIPEVELDINAELIGELNYDNGYIQLSLNTQATALTGTFVVSRASSEDNYMHWTRLFEFSLESEIPKDKNLWKDFTIKQGITYIYALQQKNQYNIFSVKKKTPKIIADFEDMFLYDGQRQLKIQFNPKVTSFKRNTPETKTDTIGGRYPFIFRNGNVDYKEFPISGLITYQEDEDHLFTNRNYFYEQEWQQQSNFNKTAGINSYNPSFDAVTKSDLSSYNISAEREFKMEVLDWLTNGEPKLFRSPTEGNFLIRLMNTSLSPNEQLGRMLHTFNATAYEIGEPTLAQLREYNVIPSLDTKKIIETEKAMLFKSFTLSSYSFSPTLTITENNQQKKLKVKYIKITGAWPTTEITIKTNNISNKFIINSTGNYEQFFKDDIIDYIYIYRPINDISSILMGELTIGYYEEVISDFNEIKQLTKHTVILEQFNILNHQYNNIIQDIENTNKKINKIYRLHAAINDNLSIEAYVNNNINGSWISDGFRLNKEEQIKEISKKLLDDLKIKKLPATILKFSFKIIEKSNEVTIPTDRFELTCKYNYPTEEYEVTEDNTIQLKYIKGVQQSYTYIYKEDNTRISSNNWYYNSTSGIITFRNIELPAGTKLRVESGGYTSNLVFSESFNFQNSKIGDIFEPDFLITAEVCNKTFDLDNIETLYISSFDGINNLGDLIKKVEVIGLSINDNVSCLQINNSYINLESAQDYTVTFLDSIKILKASPNIVLELTYDYTERN